MHSEAAPTGPPAGHRRVRVTHPRTEAGRRAPARAAVREIEEQTDLGSVFITSLLRTQRRSAAVVCAVVATLLAAIALGGAVAPSLSGRRVLGLPLPWLVLGLAVYPALIGIGWWAVRAAERHERDFAELVRRR